MGLRYPPKKHKTLGKILYAQAVNKTQKKERNSKEKEITVKTSEQIRKQNCDYESRTRDVKMYNDSGLFS